MGESTVSLTSNEVVETTVADPNESVQSTATASNKVAVADSGESVPSTAALLFNLLNRFCSIHG